MDYKKSNAPTNTITWDTKALGEITGNIYESVMIAAKRSNQISVEMKEELNRKLQEFASYTDNLEEVFENREQIEISKFYERLPKPTALAVTQFLEEKVYYRNPEKEENPENTLKDL
ncbi:MAG TPA: DNA-directed RNA polymerase subunit omega [Marinilabiliaceae bacterium]|nr:DNA-directed RNA polymerase subunit omega [Marinilabiliaceae bacterium]